MSKTRINKRDKYIVLYPEDQGLAEQMVKSEAQGKQIDRIESMLERMIG